MISHELLDSLHCPYCGDGLSLERELPGGEPGGVRNGILHCACYRYPIIDGIPVLNQRSGSADTFDPAVVLLEKGDVEGALAYQLNYTSPIQRSLSRWQHAMASMRWPSRNGKLRPPRQDLTLTEALRAFRPSTYADYLFYRHANSSFLAAIPLFLLFRELESGTTENPRKHVHVLDLNCGIGHASFLIRFLFPVVVPIATDHDFVNLYLARRFLIPGAACICVDAELPMPFGDQFFDGVVCMDGLHYVRSKKALVKELDRVMREDGIILFPHLHNALRTNVAAGVPLCPESYARCVGFLPCRLLDEAKVLSDFVAKQELDLKRRSPHDDLNRASELSIVASRREDIWRVHGELAGDLLARKSNLEINPIYRQERRADQIYLRMVWPNSTLEHECEEVRKYLPAECRIDSSLLSKVKQSELNERDLHTVEELVRSFVLVPIPENYS